MIGFVLSGWLCSHEACCCQTIYTYNALYVSVSGGFSVPCMVFNSIMSQNTCVIDFYIGYFGHVTKYTCMVHRYPHGFLVAIINKAFFKIDRAFYHISLFTFHSNIRALHLQPIRFLQTSQHEYLTHGYQEGFFLFWKKVYQLS